MFCASPPVLCRHKISQCIVQSTMLDFLSFLPMMMNLTMLPLLKHVMTKGKNPHREIGIGENHICCVVIDWSDCLFLLSFANAQCTRHTMCQLHNIEHWKLKNPHELCKVHERKRKYMDALRYKMQHCWCQIKGYKGFQAAQNRRK